MAGYCATKGGVCLFAKAVAMECAAEGDGIRVNTVHPGVIDTPIWTKIPASAGSNEPIDGNEIAKAGVPLRRAGQTQGIANRALFLASDGDLEGALVLIGQLHERALELGDESSLPGLLEFLALFEFRAGNWQRADEIIE